MINLTTMCAFRSLSLIVADADIGTFFFLAISTIMLSVALNCWEGGDCMMLSHFINLASHLVSVGNCEKHTLLSSIQFCMSLTQSLHLCTNLLNDIDLLLFSATLLQTMIIACCLKGGSSMINLICSTINLTTQIINVVGCVKLIHF